MIQTLASEPLQLRNAGIVLLHPFLTSLFLRLGLLENGQFFDDNARIKAVYLMCYSVHGIVSFPDSNLVLLKALAGLDINALLSPVPEIGDNEKETVDIMLSAVIQNWNTIGNTSVEGFRESFLQREGKLVEEEGYYALNVDNKAYDILLQCIPWSFSIIKFPWMAKAIRVNWI